MAEPILSQEEMDALLKGVAGGDIDTSVSSSAMGALKYDMTDVNHYVTLNPEMTMKAVSERFIPHIEAAMSKAIRRKMTITLSNVETVKFGGTIGQVPPMSYLNLLKVDPLSDAALLVMPATAVYFLFDFALGGKGRLFLRGEGDYTLIERRFIERIVEVILAEYRKAWQPVHPVAISLLRSDCNVRNMRVLSDKDLAVISRFRIEINNKAEEFFFCFAFSHFDRLRRKIYGGPGGEVAPQPEEAGDALYDHLTEGCTVSVAGVLGETTLTIPEIVDLEVGDLVMLNQNVHEDLALSVEGLPKFYGQTGAYKGKRAFQIQHIVDKVAV
ncbi:MAG: FliM/FliN family flagellar motor switch protein [Nitrospirota bacterium]|mgnify:CR=1 FL=1